MQKEANFGVCKVKNPMTCDFFLVLLTIFALHVAPFADSRSSSRDTLTTAPNKVSPPSGAPAIVTTENLAEPDTSEEELLENTHSATDALDTLQKKVLQAYQKSKETVKKYSDKLDSVFIVSDEQKRIKIEALYHSLTDTLPHVPYIDPESLSVHLKDSLYILVDVRDPVEQQVSMLPGAFTTTDFSAKFKKPADLKNRIVVVYCTIGFRSAKYANELSRYHIPVINLRSGIMGWAFVNGGLYDGSKPPKITRRVHVYSDGWNYLPSGYEAVY